MASVGTFSKDDFIGGLIPDRELHFSERSVAPARPLNTE
jgi:hypothetical protein